MNVVFVFNEFSLHNHIISSYLQARPSDRVSIVKVRLVLRSKSRVATATRIFPKLPLRFIRAKFSEFFAVLVITFVPKILPRGAVFRRLRQIARRNGLAYHRTDNVMAAETLNFIREQEPDIIVTLVHQIFKKELIDIPHLGVVNIHPGLLPNFRGIQPYLWCLSEDFGHAGPTLHFIEDESIDTGGILATGRFSTWKGMSVQLVYFLTCKIAGELLPECLNHLSSSTLAPEAQDPAQGAYYRWPDEDTLRRLYTNGYCLTSVRDLWHILTGRHDSFANREQSVETKINRV